MHMKSGCAYDMAAPDPHCTYPCGKLPANLRRRSTILSAHAYARADKPRGEFFRTNRTDKGGSASAATRPL